MSNSRTENSIRNSIVALIGQGANVLLSFITRTIFINTLGSSYLGVNGLFTNILTVISFAELGFGTAITYAMYKPLATNDEEKISALMNFYSKAYTTIGVIILIVGVALIPNLSFFINDISELPSDMPSLRLVYILFLLNSVVSYFFNYKRSIIIASQNGYLNSLNEFNFSLIKNVLQIILLLCFKDYLLYLLIQIISIILSNISISRKADKMFPYLKKYKKLKLDKESKHELKKNVFAMAFNKLGSVVVSGVDNILISKFVGIIAIGCYSNYVLLNSTIKTVFNQIMSPITASVGNYVSTKSDEENFSFFKKLFFINAYMAIFCTVCLASLSNAFIELVWGKEYVFTELIVILISFNFYLDRMRQTSQIFIDTKGLFWPIKWKSFVESIINLTVSLYLLVVLKLGIAGVVIGTITSNLLTNFWWEPYVVFKYGLKKNIFQYFKLHFQYTTVLILSFLSVNFINSFISNSFLCFILKCIICIILPNIIILIIFHEKTEYKNLLQIISKIKQQIASNRAKPSR